MKKVRNYLGLRKVAINLQLDKLPADAYQYVAELEEELRQIDQALLVLSNVVKQSEQFTCSCGIPPAIRLCEGVQTCLECGDQLSK